MTEVQKMNKAKKPEEVSFTDHEKEEIKQLLKIILQAICTV